jgi:hypothetical protein
MDIRVKALEWLEENAVPMGGRLLAVLAILIIGYIIAQIAVKIVRGALKRSLEWRALLLVSP